MKLVIASNNQNKIREIKSILDGQFDEIISMGEAGYHEEIEETGTTFRENALIKARHVMEKMGCAALADDSGLEVYALGGRPGVYSARYSGEHGDDEANNLKLVKEMHNVPEKGRQARYACVIALCRPGMDELTAEGFCEGVILREPRGNGGFGYDPYFFMEAFDQTMAEMDIEIKNKISHRYNALKGLSALLKGEDEDTTDK